MLQIGYGSVNDNFFVMLGRFHRVKMFTDLVEAYTETARLLLNSENSIIEDSLFK